MGQKKMISGDIHAQTSALVDMTRQLSRKKLSAGQTPAERSALLAQKTARVELAAARNGVAIAGTLTAIAEQIGLESCTLDVIALRGALLTVMDSASDETKVTEYRQRDAAFQSSRRRVSGGVRGIVLASRPGAELIKAGKAAGLRRDLLAGGLVGRASPQTFAALGRAYGCSVNVTSQGELVQLVTSGVVDEDVLSLLGGQGEEKPEQAPAPKGDGEAGETVLSVAAEAAETDLEGQGGTNLKELPVLPRIGSPLRRPMAPASDRRVLVEDDNSAA